MKNIFIFLLFLFIAKSGNSQNVSACNNAQNICSNPSFLFQGISGNGLTSGSSLNISNPTTNPQMGNGSNPGAPANAGCLLTSGPGPQWLVLTVSSSGNLEFSFGAPGSANPQVGLYDWEMWLYTPTTCANIFNNTLPPVSCNWNGSGTGGTGMGAVPLGGSPSNYQPSIPVTVGQQYLILISNYSGVTTPVSFTSTGTAGLSCGFNSTICAGNSVTVTPVGFVPLTNQSYTLTPGGISNLTGSFVVTPTVTTTYTITGSGTNSQNQPAVQTSTTNVTVYAVPLSSPTTTQTTCTNTVSALNLGLSFFPASPVPTYTVTWIPTPAGITSNSQVSTSGGITPGTYTAVITSTGGCSTTTFVSINPAPAASIFTVLPSGSSVPSGPVFSITCNQPTVVLDGSQSAYTYTWTNGVVAPMSGQTTSYTPFTLGNWTVTGINPVSGCISSRTFTVVLNNNPPVSSVSPINQSVTCGPGVVATATGVAISPSINVTHSWYAPGISSPYTSGGQLSIYNPIVGTSTYVLTDDLNGCSTSKTIQVVSTAGFYPTFSVTSLANFTLGCSTTSVSDVNIVGANTNPPPGGGVVSYTLLPPAYTGTNYATSVTVPSYTVNSPGTYTVIVKDNGNQCETRLMLSIIQNTFSPDIFADAATRTLSCLVPSVNLIGSSTTPNIVYTWKKNTLPPLITNSVLPVSTTSAGASVPSGTVVDTYTLTIQDKSNLCFSNTVVTVYQNTRAPKPGIALSHTALTCAVYSVNATNNSTTGVLPNTFFGTLGLRALLWQGPSPQQDLQNNSTYLGFTPGIYTMTVMDLDNGCTSVTTAVLGDNRVYPVISTSSLAVLDCGAGTAGAKLTATVVGLTAAQVNAQWYLPDPSILTSPTNSLSLTTDGIGDYKLVVSTKTNGCTSSAVVKVINGILTADFSADLTTGYAPLTVNFTNNSASSIPGTATQSITSVWSFGNGTTKTTTVNTTVANTSAVYSQPGSYTVTMYAVKGSCVDTFYKVIKVDIPSKLEVPNVFTPNGDNSNDIFFVKTANLSEITAMIFDRWGNKIYELTTDKGNIAWDGKTQAGKEAPDGTYFYVITAKGKDAQDYNTKGTVSLYR